MRQKEKSDVTKHKSTAKSQISVSGASKEFTANQNPQGASHSTELKQTVKKGTKDKKRKALASSSAASQAVASADVLVKGSDAAPPEATDSGSCGQAPEAKSKPAADADGTQLDAEQPAQPKKNRRRSKAAIAARAAAAQNMPAEELQRRRHQQERQALAIRLKLAGRPYLRQKPKKPDTAGASGTAAPAASTAARSSKSAGRAAPGTGGGVAGGRVDSGERPSHVVQVIIVPIFWLKREAEMRDVIAAAHLVQKVLSGAGIDSGVDTTVPMSPGQKFKHWEMAGVKVRVEVGPKEAEQHSCILAVCSKPGEVAAKSTVQVGQELLDSVRRLLPQLPSAKASEDRALLASLGIERGSGRPGGSAPRANSGKGLLIDAAATPNNRKLLGGDDLEDDFVEEVSKQAEKAGNAAKSTTVSRDSDADDQNRVLELPQKPNKKKKPRTVVF